MNPGGKSAVGTPPCPGDIRFVNSDKGGRCWFPPVALGVDVDGSLGIGANLKSGLRSDGCGGRSGGASCSIERLVSDC